MFFRGEEGLLACSRDVPCSLVPGQPCVRRDQAASSWVCGADVCKRFPGVTCAMRACAIPITRACTHHPCIYTRVASSARPDGAPDPPHPGPWASVPPPAPGPAFWSRHRPSSAALALLWEGDALRCWRSRSTLCARGRARHWSPPSVYPRLKSPPLPQILRTRAGPRGSVGTGHRPPDGLPTRLGLSRPRLALTRAHSAVSRPRCSRAANGVPAGTGVDCPSASVDRLAWPRRLPQPLTRPTYRCGFFCFLSLHFLDARDRCPSLSRSARRSRGTV